VCSGPYARWTALMHMHSIPEVELFTVGAPRPLGVTGTAPFSAKVSLRSRRWALRRRFENRLSRKLPIKLANMRLNRGS
jgi:hypothetical protein